MTTFATLDIDDGVAGIPLDRPQQAHAFGLQRALELACASAAAEENGCAGPVITGSDDSFGAGDDVREMAVSRDIPSYLVEFVGYMHGESIGLTPDCGVARLLLRTVGARPAAEMCPEGRVVGADDVAVCGQTGEVVGAEQLTSMVQARGGAVARGAIDADPCMVSRIGSFSNRARR